MDDRDANRNQDERGRQCHERRREQEPQRGRQPFQESVGVDRFETKTEQVASDATAATGPQPRLSLPVGDQPQTAEPFDEMLQRLQRQRHAETLLDALTHRLDRGRAIQLLRDKVLGFSEAEIALGRRIFDDEERAVRPAVAADEQVVSQLECGGTHSMLCKGCGRPASLSG